MQATPHYGGPDDGRGCAGARADHGLGRCEATCAEGGGPAGRPEDPCTQSSAGGGMHAAAAREWGGSYIQMKEIIVSMVDFPHFKAADTDVRSVIDRANNGRQLVQNQANERPGETK